jgi:hypothetical protein
MLSITESLVEVDGEEFFDRVQETFFVENDFYSLYRPTPVGDMFDALMQRPREGELSACLTRNAFYQLRASLANHLGVPVRTITPSTPMAGLLSSRDRCSWWHNVQSELGIRLPSLILGGAAIAAYWFIWTLPVAALMVKPAETRWLCLAATLPLMVLLSKAAARLPRHFPMETVGDLARVAVDLNYSKFSIDAGGDNRNQAWRAFQRIIRETAFVEPEAVTRDLRVEIC